MEFAPGAGPIKVCAYCNTVVFRGEQTLEKLGKVAELVDTDSPLKVGLAGRYQKRAFTIVGRIQKANATGTWDEWCLTFDDERIGWLAEAEGRWNIMLPFAGAPVPFGDAIKVLGTLELNNTTFTIEEVNHAKTVSAEGQLPDFAKSYEYVEATGPMGAFVSLEFENRKEPAEAYVGHEVSLLELGFDRGELQPSLKREALRDARCPNCNGMLALKAPDASKRVACPYCNALISVQGGALSFLELLEQQPYTPLLPLGTTGTLDKAKWVVIAYLRRSCEVEGTQYPWEEYLLFNQQRGFTWLMCSNNHWSWLQPLSAGEVQLGFRGLTYNKQPYREYQRVYARTDYVIGECYWAVKVGELAKASEFVAPPLSVNFDETETEVSVTRGALLSSEEIQKAFSLKQKPPEPSDIAPAQPNPWRERAADGWRWGAIWSAVLVGLCIVFALLGNTETYLNSSFTVPLGASSGSPDSQIFTQPFEIKRKTPLEVELAAPGLSNDWFGASVDLVNQNTGEVISVYSETEYYSGTSDGESWSEGSHTNKKQTDDVEAGTYVARITPQFATAQAFSIRVQGDDTPGFLCPLLLIVLLLAWPLFAQLKVSSFETQRWNEAVFQTSPGVSTFPFAVEESSDDD